MLEFKPDIVDLSTMFENSYTHVKDIPVAIRKYNEDAIILLGGIAATTYYITIVNEQDDIDGICYYEGEIPLLNLVNSSNMLGLSF